MAKQPNNILFWIGTIMIILGILLLIFPIFGLLQQASVGVETSVGSAKIEGISQYVATVLFSGIALILLGLAVIGVAYKVGR